MNSGKTSSPSGGGKSKQKGGNKSNGNQQQRKQEAETSTQPKASSVEISKNESSVNNVNVDVGLPRTGDYYADSYSHFGIHEEMIKDSVRTQTYQKAIMRNAHLFRGKVVLDVGCGTGILSLFAAQAGARLVIGVDMSAIAEQATIIAKVNKLDHIVKIIRGKIEEVDLSEYCDKVDIIISEWMGYALLYESMLDSVLIARDKWLRKGGLIFPDKASMYLVAIEDGDYKDEKIKFWDNVYGFDFTCFKPWALREPLVDTVDAKQIMSRDPCKLFDIDINTVKREDLDFTSKFTLVADRNDYCHGFLLYFDVTFAAGHKPISFSTSPECQYTHWKQTTFYLIEDLIMSEGEKVEGVFSCSRNTINHRELDIRISYEFKGKDQTCKREGDLYHIR